MIVGVKSSDTPNLLNATVIVATPPAVEAHLHHRAVHLGRDAHRPVRQVVEVVDGPVDRVDHPPDAGLPVTGGALFPEEPVAGTHRGDALDDQPFGRLVHLGHHVGRAGLGADLLPVYVQRHARRRDQETARRARLLVVSEELYPRFANLIGSCPDLEHMLVSGKQGFGLTLFEDALQAAVGTDFTAPTTRDESGKLSG